jgi:hypothetical protein
MMRGMTTFPTLLDQADAELAAGDPRGAFRTLRAELAWPGPEDLGPALERLARVADAAEAPEIGDAARWAAAEDAEGLVALGSLLVDEDAPEAAATMFARARRLDRDDPETLGRLTDALGLAGHHADAVAVLADAPDLAGGDFTFCWRYAVHLALSGDLAGVRRLLPGLLALESTATHLDADDRSEKVSVVRGMVARHELLWSLGGPGDLRGWHWVTEGGILLHQSPAERTAMNGRYGFVEDTHRRVLEGVLKAAEIAEAVGGVPRVLEIPDRDSAVLARAVAAELEVPVVPWARTGLPGLMPIYDLHRIDPGIVRWLRFRSAGQLLWVHALCWTRPADVAPDLVTFLHQRALPPWEGESASVDELAHRLLTGDSPDEDFADLPELGSLVDAVKLQLRKSVEREGLRRPRHFVGSPIPSRRYLA